MSEAVPASLFQAHLEHVCRRAGAALDRAGFDSLLIPSGLPPLQFSDDQPYPFKASPQFRLWVPEAWPGCFVAFEPGRKPQLFFHQPVDYWYQPPPLPEAAWIGQFDVHIVQSPADVRGLLPGGRRRAVLGPAHPDWDGLGEPNPAGLTAELDYERAAKTPYEIDCLARANRLGAGAHRAAERAFRSGASEFEIQLEFCSAAGAREEELPYHSIIAFGTNAAVLHYQNLGRGRPAAAASFLIDAGVAVAGYSSDITRTYAAVPGDFAELVTALDVTQQALAALVVPGRDYADIHLEAHREIAELLVKFELVQVAPEVAVASGLTSVFFPHGIGHLLGLQVHDVGGLMADAAGHQRPRPAGHPYLRLTRDLAAGFVVTIEPGLYFIGPLLEAAAAGDLGKFINWPRVDALRPFGGVRIEDNVVALPAGPRNLTREAFAALEAGADPGMLQKEGSDPRGSDP